MSRVLTDQTRSDLENLLAEQDRGWCAYRYNNINISGDKYVSTGIGGCLVEQMNRMLNGQQDIGTRKANMVIALGFIDAKYPAYDEMYYWNDRQRDPDAIKHRIKDALNV